MTAHAAVDHAVRRGAAGRARRARRHGHPVLSHGAGNGIEARDLAALAAALPRQGVTVALFEQPWRVAGRKIASPPPTLDVGLAAAVARLASAERRSSSAAGRPARAPPPAAPPARRRRLPGARLPAPPARAAGEDPARRADRRRGPDPRGPGRARPDGPPRGVPRGHRPGRRTRRRPRPQGARERVRCPRPRRSTWWWRRPWSGWCARSPGIPDRTGRVEPSCLP